MMKTKKLLGLSLVALVGVTNLTGCGPDKKDPADTDKAAFKFSVGIKSGAKTLVVGQNNQYLGAYDNTVDAAGKKYEFYSTKPNIATVDKNSGKITPIAPGDVSFYAVETTTQKEATIGSTITVVPNAELASGGFNYSNQLNPNQSATAEEKEEYPYAKKAEALGQLERYAMENHLTGITLFDDGGYVKYSERVKFSDEAGANPQYITGYGFGLLQDGFIDPSKGTINEGDDYQSYYHSAFSQDSESVNQFKATGSQVSDLASYITSTYWGVRRSTEGNGKGAIDTEWYPVLAEDKIIKPTAVNETGEVTAWSDAEVVNEEPVAMEEHNDTGLYKKWRIYVKAADTRDDANALIRYRSEYANDSKTKAWNNKAVIIDDYIFPYFLLLTQKNNLVRGTEMANDTSHGIKGAQRYYNNTATIDDDVAWDLFTNFQDNGKLGIKGGKDEKGQHYIDIELINAIDAFTAKYVLSSSLVSPLPKEFFVGGNAIANTMADSAKIYGTFNGGPNDAIMNNVLCVGPFELQKWEKERQIIFVRNDNWFEHKDGCVGKDGQLRKYYNIPGLHMQQINTSEDQTATYKAFNAKKIDVTSIPTANVAEEKRNPLTRETKGESTFKLNVNSCTQDQWDKIFKKDKTSADYYACKPEMSDPHFLDGLFFSINRKQFAEDRGVTPSLNYFSDSYMYNPKKNKSYNDTQAHKDAIKYYHDSTNENYGFDIDRAIDNFRIAVKKLSDAQKIVLGTREKPTERHISIDWMYSTDIREYGESIRNYIQNAFNDISVCGGKVKLVVDQPQPSPNWEDVYNKVMMKGKFDLAFGAISGNTYDPLNFLEVLKTDNSSGFTLNWGEDTAEANIKSPIIYEGKRWSFDGLWTAADHGGIVQNGKNVDPVKSAKLIDVTQDNPTDTDLRGGFTATIDVEFVGLSNDTITFTPSRVDIYMDQKGNTTLDLKKVESVGTNKYRLTVRCDAGSKEESGALYINEQMREALGCNKPDASQEKKDAVPFKMGSYLNGNGTTTLAWSFEVYFNMEIKPSGDSLGVTSEGYKTVSRA